MWFLSDLREAEIVNRTHSSGSRGISCSFLLMFTVCAECIVNVMAGVLYYFVKLYVSLYRGSDTIFIAIQTMLVSCKNNTTALDSIL